MQSLVGTSILRLNTMSVLGSFADMPRLGRFFHKTLLLAALPVGLFAFTGAGRADVIADVNAQLLNIIQYTSPALIDGPPNVAREIAMVNGAMYDAVNAASGGTGSTGSFYYQAGPVSNASAATAALAAAYSVMNNLYGTSSIYRTMQGQTTLYNTLTLQVAPSAAQYAGIAAQLNALSNALSTSIANDNTAFAGSGTNGSALGAAAATAMINGRAGDGGTAAMLSTLAAPYRPVTTAGVYATPAGRPPLEPTAGSVTPFVIDTTAQNNVVATVPGPPPVASAAYAAQVLQTGCQGSSGALTANMVAACQAAGWAPQTAAQAQAALYWNDPGGTYQPPGHWLQIADSAAVSTSLGLLRHAQEDALLGAAMSDAGAAAWQVKFAENRWRPITAIQNCATWASTFYPSGACDPNWNSLIATPPHPDYLAGHPAFSGAAATVLDNFFQADNISFTSASQVYCNAGSTNRDGLGNIVSCTLGATTYFANNLANCNNAGSEAPLNADFSVNTNYNASPLICPITIAFSGFQAASGGDLGSTFSRVAGGIHTSAAVGDALALGNAIGQLVSNDGNIPEPGTLAVLTVALAGMAMTRRRAVAGLVR
jgi:hypothetical protein